MFEAKKHSQRNMKKSEPMEMELRLDAYKDRDLGLQVHLTFV